jgi:hypothetical protein
MTSRTLVNVDWRISLLGGCSRGELYGDGASE